MRRARVGAVLAVAIQRGTLRRVEGGPAKCSAAGGVRVQRDGEVVRHQEVVDVVEDVPRAAGPRVRDRTQTGRLRAAGLDEPLGGLAVGARPRLGPPGTHQLAGAQLVDAVPQAGRTRRARRAPAREGRRAASGDVAAPACTFG